MKKDKNYQFPRPKKDLRAFLNEEEGKITKKSLQKIGLGLLTAGMALSGLMQADKTLGLMQADKTLAQCSHYSHTSHGAHGAHGAHGSHSSHGAHGSHYSW